MGHRAEQVHQMRDGACPTRLMAGTQPGFIVPMRVFVEQKQVSEVGIVLKFPVSSEYRPSPRRIAKEDPGQALFQLMRYLKQREEPS